VALAEGANSAISNGLKSGEKVVVEGQTRLKNGMAVRAEAAKTADASAAGAAGASLAQASAADGTRP
jgi:multidrug efflux system membrane fusion protein